MKSPCFREGPLEYGGGNSTRVTRLIALTQSGMHRVETDGPLGVIRTENLRVELFSTTGGVLGSHLRKAEFHQLA